MKDADTAHQRHRDRGLSLGNGIHRRRHHRNPQRQPRQLGRHITVCRKHRRATRQKQDIIERQRHFHGGAIDSACGLMAAHSTDFAAARPTE
jgi:hypothetical protein